MKVLLIHPPDSKVTLAPGRFEPLALEVLAAVIPGHEVSILDLRLERNRALERQLSSFRPDLVGVTVNNSVHVLQARRVIGLIHSLNPEIPVIVGGHHATMMPGDFHIPGVHAIFLGWAEKSLPEYIRALENGTSFEKIQGIELLENGKLLVHNEVRNDFKASDIPYPRRDLIGKYLNRYHSDMGFKTSLVNTTRGCAYRCSFCGVWQTSGGQFIIRKPEDVFYEIARVPPNIPRVFFADDNTFLNPQYALKLCRMIKAAGIKKKYSGYCRSDTITRYPDMMREWREIGLDNLCVGFETTDNDHLDELNKRNTSSNNEAAAKILNDLGMPFRPHFLIDPAFEKDDFERLAGYFTRNRLKSPIFPILTPIPGTNYYHEVRESIFLSYDYFDFAHAVVPTKLSPRNFYKSWIHLYFVAYPLGKNLKLFILRTYARISGNKELEKKSRHMRLINLFILRFVAIFLYFKIVSHYRQVEKLRKIVPE